MANLTTPYFLVCIFVTENDVNHQKIIGWFNTFEIADEVRNYLKPKYKTELLEYRNRYEPCSEDDVMARDKTDAYWINCLAKYDSKQQSGLKSKYEA